MNTPIIPSNEPSVNTPFYTLEDIPPDCPGAALYARVSKPEQLDSLPHQVECLTWATCFYAGWHTGLLPDTSRIKVFAEQHKGTTFDRPEFHRCIEFAKREGLIVAARDINRLVRHEKYHHKKPSTARPLKCQLRELLSFGVTYALEFSIELTSGEIRALEIRQGLSYGKRGGRPSVEITPELRQKIEWLHTIGASLREIEQQTGINYKKVQRLISGL